MCHGAPWPRSPYICLEALAAKRMRPCVYVLLRGVRIETRCTRREGGRVGGVDRKPTLSKLHRFFLEYDCLGNKIFMVGYYWLSLVVGNHHKVQFLTRGRVKWWSRASTQLPRKRFCVRCVCVCVSLAFLFLLFINCGELPSELLTITPASCFSFLLSVPLFSRAHFTSLLPRRRTQLEFKITRFKGVLLCGEL